MSPTRLLQERALILAPTGRDAQVTSDVLASEGLAASVCPDMETLCDALRQGAGALLIAEEALTPGNIRTLTRALQAQPPWSDIPLVVTVLSGEGTEARERALRALDPSGNVSVLERPVRVFTLVVTIQAALRARRRQYQLRDLLLQMQGQMERLQTERELRARFVSLLAHDLRGPVSAAMMTAELVAQHPEQLDQRRDLAMRIKRNLQRIDDMVRDLLDATRIQAGKLLPLRLEECELVTICRDVVEEANAIHGDRVVLRARDEIFGIWSAAELRRAVWNLVTNALKYGDRSSPVTVAVSRLDDSVRIDVHNFGAPISRDDQRRIFEPFARTREAESGSQIGWGLGLTLVRGCAEAHGGVLRVASGEGAGTTFTLQFPLDSRAAQRADDPA